MIGGILYSIEPRKVLVSMDGRLKWIKASSIVTPLLTIFDSNGMQHNYKQPTRVRLKGGESVVTKKAKMWMRKRNVHLRPPNAEADGGGIVVKEGRMLRKVEQDE